MKIENKEDIYQDNWDDFQTKQALPFILFIPFLPIMFLLIWLIKYLQLGAAYEFPIGLIFFVGFVILMIYSSFLLPLWRCPKCAERYFLKDSLDVITQSRKVYWVKKCVHCSLPKYYGSSYFLDHWGVEQAKRLTQEFKTAEELGLKSID